MLTDEQIQDLYLKYAGTAPDIQWPRNAMREAYRLGVAAERKRCAEVVRAFPLPHAPGNQLANDVAALIEKGE